jgi:xanthosine utilization system XapX-like protein
MRIALHMTLMLIGEVSGFVLGVLVTFAVVPTEVRSAAGPVLALVLLFGGAVVGVQAVRWLFGRVAARCPQCGGQAFPHGIRPICYHCRECGHTHETRVRSNW